MLHHQLNLFHVIDAMLIAVDVKSLKLFQSNKLVESRPESQLQDHAHLHHMTGK